MKKSKTIQFGTHLIIDGYNCDPKKLDDPDTINDILIKLPDKMGMHRIYDPVIIHADANGKKDPGGYTGFTLIAESHIAFHTFVKRGFVSIDVYSCTNFEADPFVEYFTKAFGIEETEVTVLKRGNRYPAEDIY